MQCSKHAHDQAIDACGACARPSCGACLIEVPGESRSPLCVQCSLIKAKVRPGKLPKLGRRELKEARAEVRASRLNTPPPVNFMPDLHLGRVEAERFFDGPSFDVTQRM